jgi:hypothetical protein
VPRPILQAQPALEFIPPDFNRTVLWTLQRALPVIIRFRTSIRDIQTQNVEQLVELYHNFQAGKVRFMLAFRHPSVDDPICLAHLLKHWVPRVAREQKVRLKAPIHAHFMYDRGIPLWAGNFMGTLYSKLGGTPIQRGKIDRAGLRSARNLFVDGEFPIAAAPEGATNGHTEIVSPLEPGVSQLGFWCAEDLHKAGRPETVLIVPIGIKYSYITPPWNQINDLLTGLELDAGLTTAALPLTSGGIDEAALYQRLYRLGEHLLREMEQYYSRFYHQPIAPATDPTTPISHEAFAERLNALLDTALKVAEEYFNLPPRGSVIDRCRRLEQAGWDCIYREDIKQPDSLSPLARGLADRVAEEADLRIWHMRLVESFVAVTGHYVMENPSVERFAETSLLMWDMMTRIKGGNPFARPKLGAQRAVLTIGAPISVSDRWPQYQENRRSAKQAVADLTQALQTALEQLTQATQ